MRGLYIRSAGTTVGKEDSQCQSQKVNREKSCYNVNINMLPKDKHHVDKLKVFNFLYTNADSLPNKLDELKARIQYCNEILAKPLTIIFNTSIQTGIVPDLWKIGNIIALFKKGDESDPGNYRPVSLTSVVGKLMERLSGKW